MKYTEIISAFGMKYLRGHISTLHIKDKFCMLDNLSMNGSDENTSMPDCSAKVRFPVRVSMSFCLFCKTGNIDVRIQQKEYRIGSDCIFVVFAGQILERVVMSDDCRLIFIAMNSEYMLNEIRRPGGKTLRQWIFGSQTPTLIRAEPEDALNFENLCRSVRLISEKTAPESIDSVLTGFTYIYGTILLDWAKETADNPSAECEGCRAESGPYDRKTDNISGGSLSHENQVLVRFREDIHSFSQKDRSVSFYAKRQYLSVKQFSRLIRKASGRKPMDLIREYVILNAKSLILTGNYSIKEISARLGFSNNSFLCRYFKSYTGISPTEFMCSR